MARHRDRRPRSSSRFSYDRSRASYRSNERRSRSRSRHRSRSRPYSPLKNYSCSRSRSRSRSRTRSRSQDYRYKRRSSYSCPRQNIRYRRSDSRKKQSYNVRAERYYRSRSNKRKKKSKKERKGSDIDSESDYDDTLEHYEGQPGDIIKNRYKIIREAGVGTFGRVLECWDMVMERSVAIKVIRRIEKYTSSAKVEADILKEVNEKDPENISLCVRLYNWFEYEGHMCLVFEKLACSLYEFLKKNNYKPFPLHHVREFAKQLIYAVDFMHNIRLVHTDLKPENILLCNDETLDVSKEKELARTDIKIIDFGGATFDNDFKSSLINTRQYRAPEVILGLDWSFPSDIWSIGCILIELYTGQLHFSTHDNLEHLALIEASVGKFPIHMINATSNKYFSKKKGKLRWPQNATSKESKRHVAKMKPLKDIFSIEVQMSGFSDLIEQLLVIDPEKRITAKMALSHPFLTQSR